MSDCKHCGQEVRADDHGTLIDPTGGDVCGWDGGNEPHETTDDDGRQAPCIPY